MRKLSLAVIGAAGCAVLLIRPRGLLGAGIRI